MPVRRSPFAGNAAREKSELKRILTSRRFFPVYQPIVALRDREVVGHEALTRFVDGTPPDVRFARAAAVGLGFDFELGAIEAAIAAAPAVGNGGFLAVNVSPGLVITAGKRLKRALSDGRAGSSSRSPSMPRSRTTRSSAGRWAASGTSRSRSTTPARATRSLRHILEIGPAWVKLDMSLVRNIDADPLRQALVAGLAHFSSRAGPRLIAEGVEREAEAQWLLGIGVEFAQGFLVGRPERAKP